MPAVPPIIVSSIGCGAEYDLESSMRPRMYGIERQEVIAHQHLAGTDAGDRYTLETEVVRRDGAALRAAGKDDALVGLGHGGAPRDEAASSHGEPP